MCAKKKLKVKIPSPKVAASKQIVSKKEFQKVSSNKKWVFSFSYFRQIEKFGLDKSRPKWFVSLLERLRDFSEYSLDRLESDHKLKDDLRYHKINWNSTNVPIKRSDLVWLPVDYLKGEDEYPMFQFMVSKALGRIVGFWNERSDVFHIVLLDPLHNIQPSKYYNYKVDDCSPLSCQYTSMLKDLDHLKGKHSECDTCDLYNDLVLLPKKTNNFNFVMCFLEEELKDDLLERLKRKSIKDIIELGIYLDEDA